MLNSPQPVALLARYQLAPLAAAYAFTDHSSMVLPLDDAFNGDERDDWLSAALEAGSYNGNLLAAPVSTSTQLLFYNAEMFEAAGIPAPGMDDRLTFEYIAEIAPQLTLDDDGDGITDVWGFNWEQTNRIYQLQSMPEGLGGDAIGPDGLTVDGVINSPEWIEAFTYYSNMFNVLQAAPQDNTVGARDLFIGGKLAMFIGGPWNIGRIGEGAEFNWSVSRHPYFENGEVVTPTGSWHIGVNNHDDHKAWSKPIWDVAATSYIVNAEWTPSTLIPSPILTDQATWSVDQRRHLIRYVWQVDRDEIFRDLFDKLAGQ